MAGAGGVCRTLEERPPPLGQAAGAALSAAAPQSHRAPAGRQQLFKQAEENRDDELLAAFLVAFDRLVRYRRRTRWQYDWQTHESWTEETLHLPGNTTPLSRRQSFRDPFTGRTFDVDVPDAPQNRLFRHRTRFYLRRWAWRYFRRLGFQRQKDDCAAGGRPLPDHQPDSI